MSRLFWTSVGAVGGIYTYRRTQRAWDRARERGVLGTAQALVAGVQRPTLTLGGYTITRTAPAPAVEGTVIDLTAPGAPRRVPVG